MKKLVTLIVCMLCTVLAFTQNRIVTGTVTDEKGVPVEGATVKVKGSKKAVIADANGKFSVSATKGTTLVVSGAGIPEKQVTVGEDNFITINVTHSSGELSAVVVTAMGVKRQAKQLGYATAKVGTEELNQAKVTNVATGLAAKVSGLQINLVNNGVKPDTRVTLRGNRSILGNNEALLVIDDIQLPMAYINSVSPADVDNVSILKGASASALYGADASNGVIIITTKKGTKGKPVIRLSSTTTMESISYMPKLQNEFGSWSGEFPDAYPGIVVMNTPYIPGSSLFMNNLYAPYENQSYGARYNGQKVPIGAPIRIYNPDGTFITKQDSTLYSANPNSKLGFFNKGLSLVNSLSYSTGDDKSKFYLSFEDNNTSGVVPKDVNRRNTIRINGSREYGAFRADYNIGYTLNHANTTTGQNVPFRNGNTDIYGGYAGGGSYVGNRPVYWSILNQPAHIDFQKYRDWQNNPFASPDGFYNAYYGNPWWQIDQSRLDEKTNDLIGNISLNLRPVSWLNLNYKAGLSREEYNNHYTKAGYHYADWAIADVLQSGNYQSSTQVLNPSGGDATMSSQTLTSDFLASMHKSLNDFDANLIIGSSLYDRIRKGMQMGASALVIPDFYNISNRVGNPNVGQGFEETRTMGAFGDLTLGYKNFLFVHGSIRNDWTSVLSENNRSYLYPAIDAAFVFSDAIASLKNSKILNYGKIRAAHSRTGKVSIGAYQLQNTFVPGPGFPYSVPGYQLNHGNYANPDIKPESSIDDEVGIELGFLNNRITFSSAVYRTKIVNQTIPITISSTTGFANATVNSGEMQNEGIELDLKFSPIQTRNFRWEIGGNYSYNKNNVISLGYGLTTVPITNFGLSTNSYAIVGNPYPTLQVSDWQRDPQGRIIINPKNGYPTQDPALKPFGTTVPPTKIGISTSFNYKGFTLSAIADGRFGAVIYNNIGADLDFTGVSAYSTSSGRQPFVIPNSSYYDATKSAYVPNTNYNTQEGNQNFWASLWNGGASNYVTSADFWKLRELSLSYLVSPKLLGNQKVIKGVTMSVQARNILTLKPKDNIWTDPEFSNSPGNAVGTTNINQLPPTKFYGFNISVTF